MKTARKLRVLVAKLGLDGHDVGARLVALAFCDAGFEVIYNGCRQTPEQIVSAAVQEDVDLIGLSILSDFYRYSFPRVLELLRESNAEDIPVVGGGRIPPEYIPQLKEIGIKEIFEPGAKPKDIVDWVSNNISPRKEIVPVNWNGRRCVPAIGNDLGWDDECIKKILQPVAGNGHSLLNNVDLGRALMYAVVREYDGITNVNEAVRQVNEGLAPLISQHPGFIDYIMVDSGGGGAIAISIFLNQADAEESNRRASDWVRENLATLVPKPPKITAGEVIAYME